MQNMNTHTGLLIGQLLSGPVIKKGESDIDIEFIAKQLLLLGNWLRAKAGKNNASEDQADRQPFRALAGRNAQGDGMQAFIDGIGRS
uniref:Uncharacterized protein n=1 Tax=viral metagenome TaxID=1070528 RepID=A0A6M3L876_9ZZZZ